MHTGVHRFLAFELLVNYTSSGTLAFSLRLVPFLPAADSPATHAGSSASPFLAHPPFPGTPQPPFLLTASSESDPFLFVSLFLFYICAYDEASELVAPQSGQYCTN
jgi:hypothetical protein